ncbi:MAG: DNA polymerase [Brachybacterium sp.]|nr:DNA polymerase [Brachybacterium sp.]
MSDPIYATDATIIRDWLHAHPEGCLAIDTETTGVDHHAPDFAVGVICLAIADGAAIVWSGRDRALARAAFRAIADDGRTLYAHNADFDYRAIRATARVRLSTAKCTLTMARTLRWGVDHRSGLDTGFSLKQLRPTTAAAQDALRDHYMEQAESWARAETANPRDARRLLRDKYLGTGRSGWLPRAVQYLPPDDVLLHRYVAEDTIECAALAEEMEDHLDTYPDLAPAVDLDLDIDAAFRATGYDGVVIDRTALQTEIDTLDAFLAAEREHFGFDPATGNHARRRWVEEVARPQGLETTDTDALSLSKASREKAIVRESIREEWVRFCTSADRASLRSKLREFEHASRTTGRIHPRFNANAARTGRMSASHPAVQNIARPRDGAPDLRRLLHVPDGRTLVASDLSHVEPSVMAALSGCPRMADVCSRGTDPYVEIGRLVHGNAAAAVNDHGSPTPEAAAIRSQMKRVLLALMYGMGATALADALGVSASAAQRVKKQVLRRFPHLRRWLERIQRRAQQMRPGYTPWGRELPAIADRSYTAQNHIIQGTAGDVFKTMTLRVAERLRSTAPTARLWLVVHDEIEVDCVEADALAVAEVLRDEMHGWLDKEGFHTETGPDRIEIWGDPEILGRRWKKF